ncbi:virulence plasmid 65kDa B protein-domain-containing protein [Podospora aff. communis PSN243]|uniref:Virulence plasmid 65kDa B protein-domain-containing protein n=1 Tax=Podospora aff. communis PSN243 TaxID=3040156 RepID=A0AAV9GW73_9PEZI|nr:virulence plasmid 65kDa B protein-domain-containing protein [Podospora aff. communis PSN243]
MFVHQARKVGPASGLGTAPAPHSSLGNRSVLHKSGLTSGTPATTAFGTKHASQVLGKAINGVQEPGLSSPGFKTSFSSSGKGGGSFRPIAESFSVNPANGTLSLSIPIHTSPTRGNFGPKIELAYDSGAENGPFGFGWHIKAPSISRKTCKGVPLYDDDVDVFVSALSGDLVPEILQQQGTEKNPAWKEVIRGDFVVRRYRPRVVTGSGRTRIERWSNVKQVGDVHWRTISSDNVTSLFGTDDTSRIFNVLDGTKRIFAWLLSRSYDALGNAIQYSYKQEDGSGLTGVTGQLPIWETQRSHASRCTQKYLKSILYGNCSPARSLETWDYSEDTWPKCWMFQVVFDYGEHDTDAPGSAESRLWPVRQDAFSHATGGFEIRTYRLCRRVLMFHRFPEETGREEILTWSSSFSYDQSAHGSFLSRMQSTGHDLDAESEGKPRYKSKSLPSMTFQYTVAPDSKAMKASKIATTRLLSIPGSRESEFSSEWVDLEGVGLPGLLTVLKDGTMMYQDNKGALSGLPLPFSDPRPLRQQASSASDPAHHFFQDLDRNGQQNLVCLDRQGHLEGYFERESSDAWSDFSSFPSTPTGSVQSDNFTLIDLTGDGLSDLLYEIGGTEVLAWQPCGGKNGFGVQRRISLAPQAGGVPCLASNADVRTYAADMNGDGLTDLVQVQEGKVVYWPNFGDGNFGAPVEMGNPPRFAAQGDFDHSRLRLMDIDGSGTTDLLYLPLTGGAKIFFNLAGNAWSESTFVSSLPAVVKPASVSVLDFLGTGTAQLCWLAESTSCGEVQLHHVDLMGGIKPHLLKEYSNGLGAVTTLDYVPSTKYFLQDDADGTPWKTRLPFPVQCIGTVIVRDSITDLVKKVRYSYHHGYYDPAEKEFAGFSMVEQWQDESVRTGVGNRYEKPTAYTKTWFSTGNPFDGHHESTYACSSRVSTKLHGIDSQDLSDAYRALRGTQQRSEVYGLDGTTKAHLPFSTDESAHDVRCVQPKHGKHPPVFEVSLRETASSQFEREMSDPRVEHEIVLEVNDFGDVERALRVIHPRSRSSASAAGFESLVENQTEANVVYSDVAFTNSFEEEKDAFRGPALWRERSYEILNCGDAVLRTDVEKLRSVEFASMPDADGSAKPRKALLSERRAYFKTGDLFGRLPAGILELYSTLDQTYEYAFRSAFLSKFESSLPEHGAQLGAEALDRMGYVKIGPEGYKEDEQEDDDAAAGDRWWVPSSRLRFTGSPGGAANLQAARMQFYTPIISTDPFGHDSWATMDDHWLMVDEVVDAAGNVTAFDNDYTSLQPFRITDMNHNRHEVALDPLGVEVGHAIMGKIGENLGDSLDGFDSREISRSTLETLLSNPGSVDFAAVLGHASTRVIQCLDWTESSSSTAPNFVVQISRDVDFRQTGDTQIHISVAYLDGFGSAVQTVELNDPDGNEQRWLFGECAISDALGNSVRTFQPFFSSSPSFVPPWDITTPASTMFTDTLGRTVATLSSDHLWTKAVFSPWSTTDCDAGDTVHCKDPRGDQDVGQFFSRVPSATFLPTWLETTTEGGDAPEKAAAAQSLLYSNCPHITHFGICGLPLVEVQQADGGERQYILRYAYDNAGNKIREWDAMGRLVEKRVYDSLHREVYRAGMDEGERWTLADIRSNTALEWDRRRFRFRYHYDSLGRLIEKWVDDGSGARVAFRCEYGETVENALERNLRGRVWRTSDQSGQSRNVQFDFRGNCLETTFQLAKEYKTVLDWRAKVDLLPEVYSHRNKFDSLGRIVNERDPDGNETRRTYKRSGVVEVVRHRYRGNASPEYAPEWVSYIKGTQFSADGLPAQITYGNGVVTAFKYDDHSRLLTRQRSVRPASTGRRDIIEDITHAYDCLSRRVHTQDLSEKTVFFRNHTIKPVFEYKYDSIGQLVAAKGRARITGSTGRGASLRPHNASTGSMPERLDSSPNPHELYTYMELYKYDMAGNLTSLAHSAPHDRSLSGWTRRYAYEHASFLDSAVNGNRLSGTSIADIENVYQYAEDDGDVAYSGGAGKVGCITSLPGFASLAWNPDKLLASSSRQKGVNKDTTYYIYNHNGARVVKDMRYLDGGLELQIESNGPGAAKASTRRFSSILSNGHLIARLELGDDDADPLVRYQIGSNTELDESAQLISYEEYSPFGVIVYTTLRNEVGAPREFRFANYRRDSETGLYHCGARYYMPWLGRWLSADPLGTDSGDGPNLYAYARNNPVNNDDPGGMSTNPGGDKVKKTNFLKITTTSVLPPSGDSSTVQSEHKTSGAANLGFRFAAAKQFLDSLKSTADEANAEITKLIHDEKRLRRHV